MTELDEANPTRRFRSARDFLLAHREDYAKAHQEFRWPELDRFNWATDWFDVMADEQPNAVALWIVEEDDTETRLTFAELRSHSQRFAHSLRAAGVDRGDRVLLLLGNVSPLWVTML